MIKDYYLIHPPKTFHHLSFFSASVWHFLRRVPTQSQGRFITKNRLKKTLIKVNRFGKHLPKNWYLRACLKSPRINHL